MDTAPPWVDTAPPSMRQPTARRPTPPADSLAVASPYLDDDASVSVPLTQTPSFRREGARPRPFAGDLVILDIVEPAPVWIGALAQPSARRATPDWRPSPSADTPLSELITAPVWTAEALSSPPCRLPVATPRSRADDNSAITAPAVAGDPGMSWDQPQQAARRPGTMVRVTLTDDSPLLSAAVAVATDRLGQGWSQQTVQPRRLAPWHAAPAGELPPGTVDTLTSMLTVDTWGQPVHDRQRPAQRIFAPNAADVLTPALVGQTYAVDAPFTVRFSPPWRPFDAVAPGEPDWTGAGVIIVVGPYWIPACGIYWAGAVEGDTQED
jgi:hypothetical protein